MLITQRLGSKVRILRLLKARVVFQFQLKMTRPSLNSLQPVHMRDVIALGSTYDDPPPPPPPSPP
jgi:hypothetical protein